MCTPDAFAIVLNGQRVYEDSPLYWLTGGRFGHRHLPTCPDCSMVGGLYRLDHTEGERVLETTGCLFCHNVHEHVVFSMASLGYVF